MVDRINPLIYANITLDSQFNLTGFLLFIQQSNDTQNIKPKDFYTDSYIDELQIHNFGIEFLPLHRDLVSRSKFCLQ